MYYNMYCYNIHKQLSLSPYWFHFFNNFLVFAFHRNIFFFLKCCYNFPFFDPLHYPEGSFKKVSSVCQLVCLLSRHFLGAESLFLNFGMVLETHINFLRDRTRFFEESILPKNWQKWVKNGPVVGFFEFIKKLVH